MRLALLPSGSLCVKTIRSVHDKVKNYNLKWYVKSVDLVCVACKCCGVQWMYYSSVWVLWWLVGDVVWNGLGVDEAENVRSSSVHYEVKVGGVVQYGGLPALPGWGCCVWCQVPVDCCFLPVAALVCKGKNYPLTSGTSVLVGWRLLLLLLLLLWMVFYMLSEMRTNVGEREREGVVGGGWG